jgi:acetyl esterase/lipase
MKKLNARLAIVLALTNLLLGAARNAHAQLAPPEKEIALYPGTAPGSEDWTWTERAAGSPSNPTVQNVVHPELMYYPADKATAVGTCVIVAPGGGFQNLMMSYEGVDIAKRLNAMGVDAFVLKYRLKFTPANPRGGRAAATQPTAGAGPAAGARPTPGTQPAVAGATTAPAGPDIRALAGADGQQAIRILRQTAGDYGFKPNRIGIIGFSAGGSVVMHTLRGAPDGRPDFAGAIYAADANGDAPPAGAPPLFIAVAADDQSVGYQGSLDLFSAWRKAGIPVELHIFQTGAHGFRKKGGGADNFMDRFQEWLKLNGELTK